jgi:PilZ domain
VKADDRGGGRATDTIQREAKRVAVDAFVKVRGEGSREFVFRTRDLSESGLFLYTRVGHSYPFRIGATLDLELYDYDEYVTCEVVVVRVVEPGSAEAEHYPTGFGVRISNMVPEQRQRLAGMLARLQIGGSLY